MRKIRSLFAALASLVISAPAPAQPLSPSDMTRDTLMVVVRESIGANRLEDSLVPMGKAKITMPGGKEFVVDLAYWSFIGDTHIRFVFDSPRTMASATPQDLERLGLHNVNDALALALTNIKRVYGEPDTTPWQGGVMQVKGKSPDLDSSYFLDRNYWNSLLTASPEGLVVSVAKRGGLLYAPVSDAAAVDGLKRGVAYLHASSENLRVSSALFLFKDGKWSVFQAPVKQ